MPALTPALIALLFVVLMMVSLWALHLRDEDASIVDPMWGPAIFGTGWVYALASGTSLRGGRLVIFLIAGAWALRLAAHLAKRHAASGEDRRYRKMREARGSEWWWRSLYVVFLFQAILAWIVALPLMMTLTGRLELNVLGWLGAGVAVFGFVFEAVADGQLGHYIQRERAATEADPDRERGVMDEGLWRYSRHPNYFGEAVVWWGLGLVALSGGHYLSLLGPALITFMLLKVSGVSMTEADIAERRPAYQAYIKKTSSFIPRPPGPSAASQD
ncbi:MAG: DUF1295 domain-containing protein [Planctomycetota bacterium]